MATFHLRSHRREELLAALLPEHAPAAKEDVSDEAARISTRFVSGAGLTYAFEPEAREQLRTGTLKV